MGSGCCQRFSACFIAGSLIARSSMAVEVSTLACEAIACWPSPRLRAPPSSCDWL